MRALLNAVGDAWRLCRPYFGGSEERWSARLLLAGVIALNLALVGLNVVLNLWNGQLFDSLQNKDAVAFGQLLLTWRETEAGFMPGFCAIAAVYITAAITGIYLQQLLSIRWRLWMTQRLKADWLARRAFYTIALQAVSGDGVDNPDQRISDDVHSFTADTLNLGISLLSNIVTIFSFATILWTLSGSVTLLGVTIPGYMLWVAILYSVVGTGLTHLVGRRLIGIEFERQRYEADFRFGLIRIRENAEGVALYGGEAAESARLDVFLRNVVRNYRAYMSRVLRLNALTTGYGQVAGIFPIVVAAPRYFAGQIQLGGVTRIADAFGQVQSAMSWFVDSYAKVAVWRATVERLTTFQAAVAAAHGLADGGVRVVPGGDDLRVEGVTLSLPQGRTLLDGAGLVVAKGRSTVVSGRSGSGKSTLFRAMAGIWPFGSGTVERPRGSTMFLPQRPYIPLGTLRQVVTYPADPAGIAPGSAERALEAAGLGALVAELDREAPWAQRLSGGEQQRLAVARAVLLRPEWLFMDEATASLDPEAEAALYQLLREALPETTVVSIAHRAEVARWHEDRVVVEGGRVVPDA